MSKAVEDARNFLRMYRAFNATVESIAAFGDVEAAVAQANSQKALIDIELEAAKVELVKAKNQMTQIKADVTQVENGIAVMKRSAQALYKAKIEEGENAAAELIAEAENEASKIIGLAQLRVDQLSDKAATLKDRTDEMQADHDKIEKALAKLKAQING